MASFTFLSSFSSLLKQCNSKRMYFCLSLFLSLSLSLSSCVFMRCVKFRLRQFANHMVMDSYCREGIVNTRFGRSCARPIRRQSPKALWRFRASTSNSLSGRSRPQTHTLLPQTHHTYARQDIRVCEDDHFQSPKRQFSNPKALWLLRVSI